MTPPHRDPAGTAVLAGCGDLGVRVGLRLAALDYRVIGLRRRPRPLPEPIERQVVDLRRIVPALPENTDLVVAALTAGEFTAAAYRDTYVTGLAHLLDAVDRLTNPPRILWVSSTAVYGTTDGSWVDEDTPATPAAATGAALREAEQLLHARQPTATVLRLAGLYGTTPNRLVSAIRDGTATVPRERQYTNRIHREDAADAIVHLSTRAPAPEQLYLGADNEPTDRGELLRFIADRIHATEPPVNDEASTRGHGKRCTNRRLRATGFRFTYPTYREGYRAVLDMRSESA